MKQLTACLGECGRRRQLNNGWVCDDCTKKIKENAMKKKIALEGPINGCTDDEATTWRDYVISVLGAYCTFHNPMDFDCRGREAELENELVAFDTEGLKASDIILVNAETPGWGTAMAVQMCFDMNKPIISICSGRVSPWLNNRSTIVVKNMPDALIEIGRLIGKHI